MRTAFTLVLAAFAAACSVQLGETDDNNSGGASAAGSGGGGAGGAGGATGGATSGGTGGGTGGGLTCDPGFGDCNGDATDGCETSLSDNDQNCGACGRSCLGGACSQTQCASVTLTTGQADPGAISVDGGQVFWIKNSPGAGAVMRISVEGTNIVSLAAPPSGLRDVIHVDKDYVYWARPDWANADKLYRRAKDGQADEEMMWQGGTVGEVRDIADDGKAVYVSRSTGSYGDIMRLAPGKSSQRLTGGFDGTPHRLAVDDANVYSYWSGLTNIGGPGAVSYMSTLGGMRVNLATAPQGAPGPAIQDIAQSGDQLYFSWRNDPTAINVMPKTGGTPKVLVSAPGIVYVLADSKHVYWASIDASENSALHRVALDGGTPETLATDAGEVGGIAQDAVAIYWTNRTASAVRKVAK
ncbi:MAG TPA: hypothetical protein PKA88_10360 [Polyangiaceae bacterium]|nr:hypothetical protein [Polyangiaceae bacterium]